MSSSYDKAYWHAVRTRDLPWPGGGTRSVHMMRIHWGCYDALVHEQGIEPATLVEFCIEQAIRQDHDFDAAFPDYLTQLDRHHREKAIRAEAIRSRKPWQPGDGPVSRAQLDAVGDEIRVLGSLRPAKAAWKPPA